MSETKSLCAKISIELHEKISHEKEISGLNLNEYIESILHQFYERKEGINMGKTKTLAFQISEELFNQIKEHLQKTGQTQKEFVTELILNAINNSNI